MVRLFLSAVWPGGAEVRCRRGILGRLAILGILLSIHAGASSSSTTREELPPVPTQCRLTLQIQDSAGTPLESRVRVFGADNHVHPDTTDSERFYFWGGGGYCYANGSFWVDVPAGVTRVTVGRGFEWVPFNRVIYVDRDTTLTITLNRIANLRQEGWYSGDLHAHSNHPPIDYQILPSQARMIARAEDLAVIHLLDQSHYFTGAPSFVSDSGTVVYYSFEYRNQAYGHAPLPGLRDPVHDTCCLDPAPAYPMLLDLRDEVVPAKGPMMVLGHPHSTDDYFYDDTWPGAGLGRELPMLAALNALDALDVLSYGNNPYGDWQEWYDILSSGLPCPPSAGTDSRLCSTSSLPIGGLRVYANLGEGSPLDYDSWLEAVRTGRTFLTNYPLIPEFDIEGHSYGDTMEVAGDSLHTYVRLRATCALGLRRIAILAEGTEVWSADFFPPQSHYEGLIALDIPTPAWILVRAEGSVGNPHLITGPSRAETSPVRITRGGGPVRSTIASARWLDTLSQLRSFVTQRGNWEETWHRDTVMTRIARAEDYYKGAFVAAPDSFPLLSPADDDTVFAEGLYLDWGEALDSEPGDRVRYEIMVATDSLMMLPRRFQTDTPGLEILTLQPNRWYWWTVAAVDRGDNVRVSTPPIESFYLIESTSAAAPAPERQLVPTISPNPSTGPVRLAGFGESVAIYSVSGRRVASSESGLRGVDGTWTWNGRIRGRRAPAGVYWVVGSQGGKTLQLIRLR